jgi:hypothetical protein
MNQSSSINSSLTFAATAGGMYNYYEVSGAKNEMFLTFRDVFIDICHTVIFQQVSKYRVNCSEI